VEAMQHAERDHSSDTGPIEGGNDPRLERPCIRKRGVREGNDRAAPQAEILVQREGSGEHLVDGPASDGGLDLAAVVRPPVDRDTSVRRMLARIGIAHQHRAARTPTR